MTSSEQALAAGAVGASVTMILIIALVWWILLIIARWKIFAKAGEAGWKSIIPIYSDYVQWRIAWKKMNMFWITLALIIVGYVLVMLSGAVAYNASGALTATGGGGFLTIIGLVCMIAGAVIDLVSAYKLFASFGKGVGWFILYILFPNIMLLVLGFGSAQHQGAQD